MKLQYKYTLRAKDNKVLCIFPEKPFWFVGDTSVQDIVLYFDELISLDALRQKLIGSYDYREDEIDNTLTQFQNLFDTAKLFSQSTSEVNAIHHFDDNPPNPVINVTRRCNLNCKHCYADANSGQLENDEMTTEEIKKAIDIVLRWFKKKIIDRRVLLSGGEPFIRKDILDLIQYIADNGGVPLVNTNSLLIKESQMDTLCQCKAEVLVSLDGARKETHEYIRGINTYERTLDQIRKLKSHGVITKMSMTVHQDNLYELEDFINLAISLEADQVAVNPINILSRADENQVKRVNMFLFHEELARITRLSEKHYDYIAMSDYANVGAILLLNLKFNYCGVGSASLVIDYNGNVYPCYNTMRPELKLGNIRHDDMDRIWKESPILQELRALNINDFSEACKRCEVKYYCGGGCRGEAYYKNGKFKSKCPFCLDMKESIIGMMFRLSEIDNAIFNKRINFFSKQKEFFINLH